MTTGAFRAYEPVRGESPHIVPKPGDLLPLEGIQATVVSAGGELLTTPLAGGGQANDACAGAEDHVEDGTENFRSLGVMLHQMATGTRRERMLLDMSATSGTAPVSGVKWYSTPPIVSLAQMCTYAASGSSRHVSRAGMLVKRLASPLAATLTLAYFFASAIDFFDHSPVWM